jgi:PAT family beta-lactamase induction signal transducer AmpG
MPLTRSLRVFADRRMLIILLLGFSSGLPLALTGATLQAWLSDAKIDVGTIGLFALAGLPYTMKFVWAPFLDRFALPGIGLRRGWGMLSQLGLGLSIAALGFVDPTKNLDVFAVLALAIAFFSASQDIVLDAYRTEILDKEAFGAGAGVYTAGYRLAMVISGGAALVMADHMSYTMVYMIMGALVLTGFVTLLLAPEPKVVRPPRPVHLRETVLEPFLEFFQRPGAMEILLFVMIYKLSTLMATALTTKYLLELGYTKTLIGSTNKVAGMIATIAGTLVGGSLMIRLGLKRSLWIFGIVQALVGLTFWALPSIAAMGPGWSETGMISVIAVDNFMMGLGAAAIMGFMMAVCSQQFTGTQYALLSSLTAVTRVVLVAHAGNIVASIGWGKFFLLTIPLAIPGLLLLQHFDRWQTGTTSKKHHGLSGWDRAVIAVFMLALLALSSEPLWRWLGFKEVGERIVWIGAYGIVFVVLAGLSKGFLESISKLHAP